MVSLRGANFATKQPKFMGGLRCWLKAYLKLGLLLRNRAAIRGPLLAMTTQIQIETLPNEVVVHDREPMKAKIFWILAVVAGTGAAFAGGTPIPTPTATVTSTVTATFTPRPTNTPILAPTWAPESSGPVPPQMQKNKPSDLMSSA